MQVTGALVKRNFFMTMVGVLNFGNGCATVSSVMCTVPLSTLTTFIFLPSRL
jgi:hypothetical protein